MCKIGSLANEIGKEHHRKKGKCDHINIRARAHALIFSKLACHTYVNTGER